MLVRQKFSKGLKLCAGILFEILYTQSIKMCCLLICKFFFFDFFFHLWIFTLIVVCRLFHDYKILSVNNIIVDSCITIDLLFSMLYLDVCFVEQSYILSVMICPLSVDNNFMDDKELGYTNHFIHYNNVLSERHSHEQYRPTRIISRQSTPKPQTVLPLKRFQQYFGKVKPSLYHQLRNIFLNSTIQQKAASDISQSPRCMIQGTTMTSRAFHIKKKSKKEPNHFTIQSFNGKQLYRKAKLNHLIQLKSCLIDDNESDQLGSLVRQSMQLVKELRESTGLNKKRFTATAVNFREARSQIKQTLIQKINPNNSKEKITVENFHHAVTLLHRIKVHVPPSLSYFNVYIEEGNNSELLKMLVRRRNGWRVVEIPNNANLIWTQFYRKSIIKKRLHKRDKTEKQDELPRTSKSLPYRTPKIQKEIFSSPTKKSQDHFVDSLRKIVTLKEAQNLNELQVQSESKLKQMVASQNILVHNHFPENRCISDKKNLLINMRNYYLKNNRNLLEIIPQSYELQSLNLEEQPLSKIAQTDENCCWIIKPGENSNRGRGITVTRNSASTIQQLKKRFGENSQEKGKCVILQRYIMPFLYNKRKFDIRSYMLVTLLNGQLRLYSYEECYIRTSSKTFDITSPSRLVHLTNDAIQAQSSCYGRYEEGNKLSQQLFQRYIDEEYRKTGKDQSIWKQLRTEMQQRYIDVLQSSWHKLIKGCHQKSSHTDPNIYFEVFGMDFMIDKDFKLWLIEVNTNPAITHDCSKVLNQLIPAMLDNLLVLAVQTVMPPLKANHTPFDNKFKAIHKIDIH